MTAATERYILYDVKLSGLTKIPVAIAPNVPTMESCGEDDEVIRGL